jgi:hypothetical protein
MEALFESEEFELKGKLPTCCARKRNFVMPNELIR